jgi:hypothetical protein
LNDSENILSSGLCILAKHLMNGIREINPPWNQTSSDLYPTNNFLRTMELKNIATGYLVSRDFTIEHGIRINIHTSPKLFIQQNHCPSIRCEFVHASTSGIISLPHRMPGIYHLFKNQSSSNIHPIVCRYQINTIV